jgi:hypothetical protein
VAPRCPGPGRCVDLLFVVDNRDTMREEQILLFAQMQRFLSVLVTGDYNLDGTSDFPPVDDLHVGVVTPDLGTSGHTVPSCLSPVRGDDGIIGRGRSGRLDPTCGLDLPQFTAWAPGMDHDQYLLDSTCLAAVGLFGCPYGQPLESALKALTESDARVTFAGGTCGHADGDNAGFLRQDSILAVMLISDHDDCSVADPVVFSDADPGVSEPGRFCARNEEYLWSPERYVAGLLRLRDDPRDLVFAPFVGVPPRLVEDPDAIDYGAILSDDEMDIETDPDEPTRLVPSCNVPGRGLAYPPRRYITVAQSLHGAGAKVAVQSICQTDFAPALDGIIDRL